MGYQSLDAEGRLLDVNSAWSELLGYERAEALGRSFGDFMTPASRAAFRERFPEFLAAGEIRGAERELVRKDGTVVTVSIDGRVERDHHPSPRIHCLLRDVTDQRRAVEALRQREAAYRRLVENISDALIVDDREGCIVYANARFLELFGFTRAELSSIRLEDYVAPRDCARLRDYHERRVRGESVPERFEYEGLRRDGTTLWLEVRVTPVEEGGRIIGTQSLIRDVTASKRAEDELRRTTELLESVRAAQAAFITHGDPRPVFASLLRTLVSLTESEFGFLDEVLRDADGTPYKLSLALSDIAWSPETERLYAQLEARQLEFRNLHNLAGLPALTGEPLIANDAPNDPRAGGLPPGHPPIRTFMGLPLYFGGEVVGVAGVANRVGGYDERLARFLEPFLTACASMIHALRAKARQDETTRALRASEERYSRIVETADEGIVSLDTAQRITFANARLAEMLGVTPSELIGRPFTDFLFAEDLADHQAQMRRRREGQSTTYERRFRRRDGSEGWALVSGTALHDERGQFAGSFGMFTDITERKRAELALRESEQTRRALLNAAPDSSILIDVNGTILAINEVGARRLNLTEEEVVGRNIYTLLPPYLAESRRARVEEVLRTGRPVCFEDERAGMRMEHHVHPITDLDGVVRKLAIFARDVTAARQAEAALRESEARVLKKLRAILEPEGDLGVLELADIVDCQAIQALMEQFHRLTGIGVGILDLQGRILVATGWQDICTKFHRVHPETHAACLESDLQLSRGVSPGEFKLYRCKNHMWDMVTPVTVGGRHVGNLFLGQFLFAGETPDYETFRAMARRCGFEEQAYLEALDRVPRWSRDTVEAVMQFYASLARLISDLSYSNIKLSRASAESRRTLDQLQVSEERLRLALKATNDVIWDWDVVQDTQSWSAAGATVFGWSDIVERPQTCAWWVERVHPDDRARVAAGFHAAVADPSRTHWQDEYRFRKSDGSYALVFDRGYVMRDEHGGALRMIGAMLDVTEQKRMEQALRDREEQYRTLVTNIPGVVFRSEVSAPWRVQFCSEKALEVIGYSAADFMSDKVLYGTLIHPDDLPAAKRAVAEAVANQRPFEVEHRLIHPDGTLRWILVRGQAHYDAAGRPLWLDGVLHDVTASKRAEQERAQLAAAIEQAGEIIVITDTAGTIQYVNAAFEQITGYRRAEAIGRNPRILKSGRHDAAFYQTLWQTITAGDVWRGRFVNRRKDGTLYDEEAVLAPVRDARGQITNFVAVKRDITEQLSLAEQLRQAQKMEAIGQLAAGVAHDFNNLLTALLGYVGLARQTAAPDAATSEALEGIENLAVTAAGITKSLLMFSGRSPATLEPVNLGTLLAESAKLLHRVVPRAVTLRITAPADEPLWVRGDRTQLQQVIMNLALNARDAMPDGGELSICVTPLADDEALTDGAAPVARPAVCLSVRDTGCGMSPKTQARIFEPFFTTKPRGRGTGLGLPIVFGIVKEHGGHVDVRSALGQGSTFRVILPRVPAPAGAPPPSPTAAEPRGRGELILLAEDDSYVRALLVTELERLGYTAAAAADGEELMRLYEERRPAVRLLVLDFDLPRQTGGQCLRQIRRAGDRVPAILISGASEPRRRVGDLEARRLDKPFTLPQFAEAVYHALTRSSESEVAS